MQLDRPSKRRPRPSNRPPNPSRDSERRPPPAQTDPFAQPSDPFQAQRSAQSDPFQPRNVAAPPRPKRRDAPFAPQAAPAPAQDPFQSPSFHTSFGGPANRGELAAFGGNESAFGHNIAAFQNPAPFGQSLSSVRPNLSTFSQAAAPSSQPVPPFGQSADPFSQTAPSFGQAPDPFSQKPLPFGQNVPPFGQSASAFGQQLKSFGQKAPAFNQSSTSARENAASVAQSSADVEQHTRTPTRRRQRSSAFAKSSFDYKPATPFRGSDAGNDDLDLEQDSDAPQASPDTSKRRGQSTTQNQLLLKSVPLPLFSRAALQRHFSSIPNVHVTHVSIRGSRRPDSRRTAVITFSTEQQASIALRSRQNFKGANLQLSLFRQSEQPNEQAVNETNELFFNYVPESLFSEESITDLFDSISENGVTKVSLKERPHYGSIKRTAIITFTSTDAAAMALRSLPLYKGRKLTVSFRRTRAQASNVTAATAEEFGDVDSAPLKGSATREVQEDDAFEQDVSIDLPVHYGDLRPTEYDSASNGEDVYPSYTEMRDGEEKMTTPTRTDRQAEIVRLKAAILRKEKERAQLSHGDRGKREKKLMIPRHRETSKTEQEASRTGWRKVGEKVDIKNAENFVGTCMTMCPFKEFEDRIIQRDVSLFETDKEGEPAFTKAVKKYRRSAAISEQPSPDEVRPPEVLLDTMKHLKKICDSTEAKFADIHNFVRDRTRSLRQDFTLQGVRDESCIRIHEESVRFHILSEHRLYGTDPAVFSSTQNLEQLDKCLISLREMYDIRRDNDLDTSPNEPEMQAYYILTQMSDPKTCVQLCTGFAQDVRSSRPVQFALKVVRAASEGFGSFTRYFSLVRSAPYLIACLMHSRFSAVRVRALAVINVTHGNPNSRDNIPVSALARQLGFESDKEAEEFCRTLGMKIERVTIPSTDSKVITIRTPSEGFDEAKVAEWESSRSDILIESKAQGFKTSEIVSGSGRNDFKSRSPAKKPSEAVEANEARAPLTQTKQFVSLLKKPPSEIARTSTELPTFSTALFAPKITPASRTEFPTPSKHSYAPGNAEFKPQFDQRKGGDLFKVPEPFPMKSTMPESPRQRQAFQFTPKPLFPAPASAFGTKPPLSSTKPASNAVSAGFASVMQAKPVKPRDRGVTFSPAVGLPQSGKEVLFEKLQIPVMTEPADGPLSRKDSSSTTEPDEKPTSLELEKAARLAALTSLLTDLVDANEKDFQTVRKTIDDAQAGTLRFPKAMEVWDDAKDILQAVSERTERGLRELDGDDYFGSDGGHADIEELREKLRFCSHEGTELLDQLDEIFSKSLAVATAHLKDSGPLASTVFPTSQHPPTLNQLNAIAAYGVDDEDANFEIRELPDRGAEVRSILSVMKSVGLHRWQAVIVNLTSFQNSGNEVGIAQRWLWQRLSTGSEKESSSLCILDSTDIGSPSISIREIKEISSIPYTADLLVVPYDVRTMDRDPSTAWTALEQVLRKNRSIALAYQLPLPSIVVLYYCGSSDMPLWFKEEKSTRKSFAIFQKGLKGKGYVASCEKLELPRTTAAQGIEYQQFTTVMETSIHASVQSLTRTGSKPSLTNLRDHLVHVANSALGEVLGSPSLHQDTQASLHAIYKISESWKAVAQCLRREEARWPIEMAERRRLVEAYTNVETKLQLPQARNDSLIADYIRNVAVVAGVGIPTTQHLEGLVSFCTAFCHLMSPFVRKKLLDCPVSVVYLASDPREDTSLRKARPPATYLTKPPETDQRGDRDSSRHTPRTERQRRTKRLRDEVSLEDAYMHAQYPLRRRLSVANAGLSTGKLRAPDIAADRRRSLPASYGRRRMFELLDGLCSEEQAFDDLIQVTMDALTAKRRRLEQNGEVLAI